MLAPGARLGRFTIVSLLGKGGMGAVYRAKDDASGADVALKVLLGDLGSDPRYVERFKREAQAAEGVVHRNVVRCLGSGDEAGTLWIAFDLLPGGDLKGLVRERGKLGWQDAARLGAQVARGLAAIHSKGLVHRDMKPANVLLDASGTPKVGDLGLARGLAGTRSLTMTGELVGTFEYIAPEQTENAKVDFRADLYSFGAILYELLTGHPPFAGQGMALIAKHVSAVPKAPRELVPEIPPALDALVRRLLAKQPEVRGESALAVGAELEEIVASVRRARSRLALGVAGALTVACGVGALAFIPKGPRIDPEVAPVATRRAGPPPSPRVVERPPRLKPPAWWHDLDPKRRAKDPLPSGLEYGEERGEYRNLGDGSVLVYIPACEFQMGDDDAVGDGATNPGHRVRLTKGYFIGKYEVTNEQFARFATDPTVRPVTTRGLVLRKNSEGTDTDWFQHADATWAKPDGRTPALPKEPVVQVTWEDAIRYVAWARLRLPTEAEWECAASWDFDRQDRWQQGVPDVMRGAYANLADKTYRRWFILSDDRGAAAIDDGCALRAPVGSFKGSPGPNGTFDMLGNVWELCLDVLSKSYCDQPKGCLQVDPFCEKPDLATLEKYGNVWAHVRRGCSFTTATGARASKRNDDMFFSVDVPGRYATEDTGFRVARSED